MIDQLAPAKLVATFKSSMKAIIILYIKVIQVVSAY